MKIEKINNILMYILIAFTIFMSAFNYTNIPSQISYIKDIIIFYFTGILIKNKIEKKQVNKPKDIGKSFYILFIIIILISWLGFIYGNNNSSWAIIVRIFRYLEFFLLFFIFSNLNSICTIEYKKIVQVYITLSIILVFVHLFGYFVPNNIISIYIDNKIGNGFYRNRISLGQPAIAVFPMIISYFYLLIYNKGKKKEIVEIIVLLIGIIISTSTTGILSIICVTMLTIIPVVIKKKNIKNILIVFAIVICLGIIGIILIKNVPQLNSICEKQIELLNIKIKAIFTNRITDLSMEVRKDKSEIAISNMDNFIKRIFGLGMLGYNSGSVNVGSLENMYMAMYACYGVLGIITFILFIGNNIVTSLKKMKNLEGIFLLAIFVVFAMHAYTLEVLYLPTISYTIPMFYCYIKNKESEKENKNENIDN